MPHCLIDDCSKVSYPFVLDDYKFVDEFTNTNHKDTLIVVLYKDVEFVLSKKIKNNNIQIKFDKTTRVSPVNIIKGAIKAYISVCGGKILFSNLNEKYQTKTISNNIKNIEFFTNKDGFENFLTNFKDIAIEIGFGSGRHILHKASLNMTTLYIGLEIHPTSIEQLDRQIKQKDIKNIIILSHDARVFLQFLRSNIIKNIYIHFPVPWDKKPHRRVFSDSFIKEAQRVLKPNGKLELRTDSLNYFEYCMSLFKNYDNIKIEKNKNIAISSKYEDRWRKMQKNIYDIVLTNKTQSDDFCLSLNFDFLGIIEPKKRISSKKLIFDDYFISFGEFYQNKKGNILIAVVFGDFNQPSKRYIIIKNKKARYLQSNPLGTITNNKAHKKINQILGEL
ncbi:MAG: tRNA (guanosine(46)-N7)-methyltransferase TrmB [Campylobacteraceae bacterium 4484_166]|nr:MAG: tRNA (guanosine(46)-N7)-methyltransferase TrmB [Campylobacteraceae bacterium 4484_166]